MVGGGQQGPITGKSRRVIWVVGLHAFSTSGAGSQIPSKSSPGTQTARPGQRCHGRAFPPEVGW